jgi:hypothetical protein
VSFGSNPRPTAATTNYVIACSNIKLVVRRRCEFKIPIVRSRTEATELYSRIIYTGRPLLHQDCILRLLISGDLLAQVKYE